MSTENNKIKVFIFGRVHKHMDLVDNLSHTGSLAHRNHGLLQRIPPRTLPTKRVLRASSVASSILSDVRPERLQSHLLHLPLLLP